MKNLKNFPIKDLNKTNNLILKLKELELENKLLKEQLTKAFPTFNLEKVNKATYLKKKYLTMLYLIEFIIIFCLKDLSRYLVYELKIAPSDLLKKLFQLIKGGKVSV